MIFPKIWLILYGQQILTSGSVASIIISVHIEPPTLKALGLVKFQVNPHYFSGSTFYQDATGQYQAHFGETRDDRIREFHEENQMPVIGLWEGGLLNCAQNHIELIGTPARIFLRDQTPIDVQAGADLQRYLST